MLISFGAMVIDADQIAREVLKANSEGLSVVVEHFGKQILLSDGSLNRKVLGEIVFSAPKARKKLDQLVHPLIAQASEKAFQKAFYETKEPVFYEAALLVENGSYCDFRQLIVVATTVNKQRKWLINRNHFTRKEADARLNAQYPTSQKIAVADYVICNDGSLAELRSQVKMVLNSVRKQRWK